MLVVNIITWVCSFIFIFTSCVSCKINSRLLHLNNIIIIGKLKIDCRLCDQYTVDIQNTLQVRPDENVLLAQIEIPLLVNIWWLQCRITCILYTLMSLSRNKHFSPALAVKFPGLCKILCSSYQNMVIRYSEANQIENYFRSYMVLKIVQSICIGCT